MEQIILQNGTIITEEMYNKDWDEVKNKYDWKDFHNECTPYEGQTVEITYFKDDETRRYLELDWDDSYCYNRYITHWRLINDNHIQFK